MVSNTIQCGFESHPGHVVMSQDIGDTRTHDSWVRVLDDMGSGENSADAEVAAAPS